MQAQFHFRFTEDHLITSLLRHRQQVWWIRPFIKFKWWLVVAFGALLVLAVWKSWEAASGIVGGILGALLLGWPIDVWNIRRRFRKSPFHNDEIAFSLMEDGAHIVGRDSELRVGWPNFTSARRFPDGLLLFQGPGMVNWLPDTSAAEPDDVKQARELACSHIKDFRDLSRRTD